MDVLAAYSAAIHHKHQLQPIPDPLPSNTPPTGFFTAVTLAGQGLKKKMTNLYLDEFRSLGPSAAPSKLLLAWDFLSGII
jgi:hypothetical protein